jgi:Na+/H+-dicarboxylate symporter
MMPTFAQWLPELAPSNPIKAAADGAMLPLIVFTLGFGIALTRVPSDRRVIVVGFFSGLADAMFVIVECVVAFAPIGVFALTAPLAARVGSPAVSFAKTAPTYIRQGILASALLRA